MSIQFRTDELMEALQYSNHPMAGDVIARFEQLADEAAVYVAEALDLDVVGDGKFEGVGLAGLCVPFAPSSVTQPLPEFFKEYAGTAIGDEGGEFLAIQEEMKEEIEA